MNRLAANIGVLAAALGAATAHAQGWWGRRPIEQNDPPATELIAARWHFGTNGMIGHMGWSHNYPYSDQHLNQFITRATGIDVDTMSYRIVELGSDEVFEYPFAYISEPGEMDLTEQEAHNLREFVERGGFILIDDFDGTAQLDNMRSEIERVFAGRKLVPVDTDHHFFHTLFDLNDLNGMAPYVPGGYIVYLGLFNDAGELALIAGHNNDLANFWDWYDRPGMPLKPATDAFRLGTNAVIYSMTH
jgi:hypothetical protein